jgi:hypothetical protein
LTARLRPGRTAKAVSAIARNEAGMPPSAPDQNKIAHSNAERLLRLA